MATIEELLGASAKDIAAMNDEQLKEYLKDITNLEPPKINHQIVGVEDKEIEVDDEDIPIKKRKKAKKKTIADMEKELNDLEKELGL